MNLLRTIVVIMNDNYVRNGTSHNERHNMMMILLELTLFSQMHFFFFFKYTRLYILIFLLVLYF